MGFVVGGVGVEGYTVADFPKNDLCFAIKKA